MKVAAIDLLILDDNGLMADGLSKYLNQRFGTKVNISTFFDMDECMQKIGKRSHVIVLDYFLNGKDKGAKNGLKIFNSIKNRIPKIEVTMITSDDDVERATQAMQIGASEYIIDKEPGLYDILILFNKVVFSPIKTLVTLPVRKIIHYYDIKDYITMYVSAFTLLSILVIIGMLAVKLFS